MRLKAKLCHYSVYCLFIVRARQLTERDRDTTLSDVRDRLPTSLSRALALYRQSKNSSPARQSVYAISQSASPSIDDTILDISSTIHILNIDAIRIKQRSLSLADCIKKTITAEYGSCKDILQILSFEWTILYTISS